LPSLVSLMHLRRKKFQSQSSNISLEPKVYILTLTTHIEI
jgi:hypothetical protein